MPGLRRHGHPWGIANRRRRLQFWSERIEQRLRGRERSCRGAHIEHAVSVNFGPAQIKHADPNTLTDAHTDPNADAHTNAHPNADADAHANADADAHADAHTDTCARTRLIRHRLTRAPVIKSAENTHRLRVRSHSLVV